MTEQEIFNKVAAHLLTQKRPAKTADGCRYRSRDGLKCAVGALITDEAYSADIEDRPCTSYVVLDAIRRSGIAIGNDEDTIYGDGGTVALLRRLQVVHDSFEPHEWALQLKTEAKRFLLDSSIVDTFPAILREQL